MTTAGEPARLLRAALLGFAALACSACSRPAPDATPEGAVRAWLDRMEASDGDAQAIRDAYGLLGPAARANLGERADRASRLEGHRVEPWDMLAEGRFGLKFRPKSMVSHIEGDVATVSVTGEEPRTQSAIVHCVRVDGTSAGESRLGQHQGAWRVEPDLPAVPSLVRRDPDPAPPRGEAR